MNTCIGSSNYRQFFAAMIAYWLLCLHHLMVSAVAGYTLYHAKQRSTIIDYEALLKWREELNWEYAGMRVWGPFHMVAQVLAFVQLIGIGGLICFHCWLIYKGRTTLEICGFVYDRQQDMYVKELFPPPTKATFKVIRPVKRSNPVDAAVQGDGAAGVPGEHSSPVQSGGAEKASTIPTAATHEN